MAENANERKTTSDDKNRDASGVLYWYAKVLTKFSPLVCLGVLVFATICSVISFTLFPLPDFSDPTLGFEARGSDISVRLISYENLVLDHENLISPVPAMFVAPPDPTPTTEPEPEPEPTGTPSPYNFCPEEHPEPSKGRLVFGSRKKTSLFTADAIKSMCEAEKELFRDHQVFPFACKPCSTASCPDSWSLGTYVALLNSKTSCSDINNDDVDNVMNLLATCAPFYVDRSLQEHCSSLPPGTCTGVPSQCTNHDATYIILHFLSEATFAHDLVAVGDDAILNLATTFLPMDATDLKSFLIYQDKIHGKSYRDSNIALKGLYFDIKSELFGYFLFDDVVYFGVGATLVIFLIWVYTGSLLVMFAAVGNIAMSLLLGYFVYTAIFLREFFPFVNVATVILILAVCAGDAVVYMDLWKRALVENPDEDLVWIVKDALCHATPTMLATSITMTCAFYVSILNDMTAMKGFALFSGTTIMANFFLTLTWLPAVIVLQHKLTILCCGADVNSETSKLAKVHKFASLVFSPFRYLTYELLPLAVVKLRFVWVALFGILGIGFTFVLFLKPGLQLPSSGDSQLLRHTNLLEKYDLRYKHKFPFETNNKVPMTGIVVLGTKPVDLGNPWNPKDRGRIVFDDDFSVSDPSSQLWLFNFCRDLRNQTFTLENEKFFCFFDLFVHFMSMPCIHPVTGADSTPCCQVTPFPYPQPFMDICLRAITSQICTQYECDKTFPGPRFSTLDDHVAAHYIVFESTFDLSFDYVTMYVYWQTVNTWLEKKLETAPDALETGWFASFTYPQLYFFDLQHSLAFGIPVAIGATFAVFILTLVLTIMNVVVALLAIFSIAFTVFTTVGSLVLLGWQLNVFESVIIIMSLGLSVIYTLQYAVAYNLAQKETRVEKTQSAISAVGGAITISALSMFITGALMMLANVYLFIQFGTFLMLLASISWVFSTFFFLGLCAVVGPQQNFGCIMLPCLGRKARGRVGNSNMGERGETPGVESQQQTAD